MADGRFHSGEQLAAGMGVTRTAVWKQVRRLQHDLGLQVDAVRGRGYRLAEPLDLLDPGQINARLAAGIRARIDGLQVMSSCESTNSCAAARPPPNSGMARVWLAEHQTAGRGRRGREWVSAFASNIHLSLAWRFDLPMAALSGLSLAVGVAVVETLQASGFIQPALKWPNDVVVDGSKLAGILVEAFGEAEGPTTAVIGVGLNVRLRGPAAAAIDQPWIDLAALDAPAVARNPLAAELISRLVDGCSDFAEHRIAPFLPRWSRYDSLLDKPVRILRGDRVIEGVYRGITDTGALVLENAAGRSEHHAGEVSLRRGGIS